MKLRYFLLLLVAIFSLSGCYYKSLDGDANRPEYVVVIHGGAGSISKDRMTPEQEAEVTQKLNEALSAAENLLKNGSHAVDAVEAAIRILEDSPAFNAGKGAVLTAEGTAELDAAIMNGQDQSAGSVAGVQHVKNPISAARAVMEQSDHVMLAAQGADRFAVDHQLDTVPNEYFITPTRAAKYNASHPDKEPIHKYGTVGCVVLDSEGNLAAGTSTGGMANKKYGRVGDSPIIGAGTYAHNETVAVSCTGHGEWFIRHAVAHDVHNMVDYKRWTVERASDFIIHRKFKYYEVSGGMIVVDKHGHIAMPFNTDGMYRGYLKSTGEREVMLYGEE